MDTPYPDLTPSSPRHPARRIWQLGMLVACLGAAPRADATTAMRFTDVTQGAGLIYQQGPPIDPVATSEVTSMTGGAAAGDYDGDGWVDLFVTRLDAPDLLFRNLGNGTFADVTATAFGPAPIDQATNGVAWADIDNDNDLDLYVTTVGEQQHLLYVNDGGVFTEVASARGAQVGGPGKTVYGTGVAFGDYDRDGYLDAYVTEWRPVSVDSPVRSALLRNRGASAPGYFEDRTVAEAAQVEGGLGGSREFSFSFAPRFTDLDGDREPDLAITSDFDSSRLFWNEGEGDGPRFSDGSFTSGIRLPPEARDLRHDMGSAVGDVNGDGLLDWFVTDIYFEGIGDRPPNGNRLFLNNGDRTFTDATDAAGVRNGDWGWGAAMADFDNDGDLDITMTNGFLDGDQFQADPMRLWENDGAGVFTDVTDAAGIDETGQGRGLLTFDYDRDGDLDVFVVNHAGAPALLRNDSDTQNAALQIETIGSASNRDGVGARIVVTPDGQNPAESMVREIEAGSHFLAQSENTAHFGLGSEVETVEEVLLLWPSGQNQFVRNVPANTRLVVTETPGDLNGDGLVDAADYSVWRDNEGATGEAVVGDANGDGVVDRVDLGLWKADFGKTAYFVETPPATGVPEPSGACVWISLAVASAIRGMRR